MKRILGRLGWEVHRTRALYHPDYNPPLPAMADEPEWILDIIDRVRPYKGSIETKLTSVLMNDLLDSR
jgi:hypothetical protein